jgi:hypothetical protein
MDVTSPHFDDMLDACVCDKCVPDLCDVCAKRLDTLVVCDGCRSKDSDSAVAAFRTRIAAAIRAEMNTSAFYRPPYGTGQILARLLAVVEGG